MFHPLRVLPLLAAACFLIAGCSDDSDPQGTLDNGTVDQSTVDATSSDGPSPDQTAKDAATPDMAPPKPDMEWPKVCDPDCIKQSPELCVKNSKGLCAECLKDEHCTKNPWALGPTCDTKNNWCVCAKSADCKGRISGFKCLDYVNMCGCAANTDCKAGLKCVGDYIGHKVCKVPCAQDKECTNKNRPLCDKATGQCHACLTDKDCATGSRQGNKCLTDSKGHQSCGCKLSSQCVGNPNGPTCHAGYNRCTCAGDAECKTAPYSLCTLPYKGAAYAQCQKKCVNPTDCGKGMPCITSTSKCGECLADAHCTATATPYCQAATSTCVACKSDSQCASGSKKYCAPILGICRQCLKDSHCTSKTTPFCDPLYQACFECVEDKDCKSGYTWGNKCTFNMFIGRICRCSTSADCAGSPMGPTCYAKFGKCTCQKDADCTVSPHNKCLLPYPTATYKRCQKPCATDAECKTMGMAPVCHKTSGACVGCTSDADCKTGTRPFCNTTTLSCVGCKASSDCASSLYGGLCSSGVCTCKATTDCPSTSTWGQSCIGTSSKRCGCAKTADCATSHLGKVCNATYSICSCIANTDCPTGKACSGKSVVGTGTCK